MQDVLCKNCFESITNPICKDCFIIQIDYYLKDKKINNEERKLILNKINVQLSTEAFNNPEEQTECILCKKEEVSVCSYCLFLRISRILKKIGIKKELTDDFLKSFNYRHWIEEY
jgi:hypothetical protein